MNLNISPKLIFTPSFMKRSETFKTEFQKFIDPVNDNKYFSQDIQNNQSFYSSKDMNKIYFFLKWTGVALAKSFIELNNGDCMNLMTSYRNEDVKQLHSIIGYDKFCFFKDYNTTYGITMQRLKFLTNELIDKNYNINNYHECRLAYQNLIIKLYKNGYTAFFDLNLANLDFSGIEFKNCNFQNSSFWGANLRDTKFINSVLYLCNLSAKDAHGCIIKDSDITSTKYGFQKTFKQFTIINPQGGYSGVSKGINNLDDLDKDDIYCFANSITNEQICALQKIFAQCDTSQYEASYLCPNGTIINLICPITLEHDIKNSCVIEYPTSSGTKKVVNIYNADALCGVVEKNPKKCPLNVPYKNLRFLTSKEF